MRELASLVRVLILLANLAGFAMPSSAVTLDWVFVSDPDNAPDTPSNCFAAKCGSVSYDYSISRHEITNEQYAEFLNAKAAADPLMLYSGSMGSEPQGGIVRSGSPGSFTYVVKPGFAYKPVNYVSFYDALRFANWLHNGQQSGDTETGAYTLLGGMAVPSNGATLVRNAGARVSLPSENEWYKAAYYDPETAGYYAYPAGSNAEPVCAAIDGGGKRANCGPNAGAGVTAVGTYTGSTSPYGTFDQGGNVWEWNEQITNGGLQRGRRGGDFNGSVGFLAASDPRDSSPTLENVGFGFRVATRVPQTIDFVYVGDPGNAPDSPPSNCYADACGSVAYGYYISKYEITNAQYVAFLNAKAKADPLGLYNPSMGTEEFGGITRGGSSGTFSYSLKPGFANKPVGYVSLYDSWRFANWLHNGRGDGDTETGAYTLLGGTAIPGNAGEVFRNIGANVFLPSENEWYKAAYYDPASEGYFDYPARSSVATVCSAPTSEQNRANCSVAANEVTEVGAYSGSPSPWGTFDQGGNVFERNEEIVENGVRGARGGSWDSAVDAVSAALPSAVSDIFESDRVGLRIATLVPEPGAMAASMAVLAALAGLRWCRDRDRGFRR